MNTNKGFLAVGRRELPTCSYGIARKGTILDT
jgi:hypothetical protein